MTDTSDPSLWLAALLRDQDSRARPQIPGGADLARLAQEHGVEPLLQRALARHAAAPITTAQQAALQAVAAVAVAHNLLIYHALAELLAALAPHTTVVVLKGVALGPVLYPATTLRSLRDIDLLVPREDMPAALSILNDAGYRHVPEIAPGINQQIEHHEHLEGGPHQSIAVDLHWNLVSGDADWRTPPMEWFWQQTEPWQPQGNARLAAIVEAAAAQGQPVQQLTPTANLLYLAAHCMLQHGGAQARLIWLYDLHLLLTTCAARIDWPQVLEHAAAFRWAAALRAALLETGRCFGTPLPEGVLDALAQRADAKTSQFVQRKATTLPTSTMDEWLKISAQRWPVRWRMIARLLLPTPGYIRWRYASSRALPVPLGYGYHWLRIIWAVLAMLAQLVARRRGQPLDR